MGSSLVSTSRAIGMCETYTSSPNAFTPTISPAAMINLDHIVLLFDRRDGPNYVMSVRAIVSTSARDVYIMNVNTSKSVERGPNEKGRIL